MGTAVGRNKMSSDNETTFVPEALVALRQSESQTSFRAYITNFIDFTGVEVGDWVQVGIRDDESPPSLTFEAVGDMTDQDQAADETLRKISDYGRGDHTTPVVTIASQHVERAFGVSSETVDHDDPYICEPKLQIEGESQLAGGKSLSEQIDEGNFDDIFGDDGDEDDSGLLLTPTELNQRGLQEDEYITGFALTGLGRASEVFAQRNPDDVDVPDGLWQATKAVAAEIQEAEDVEIPEPSLLDVTGRVTRTLSDRTLRAADVLTGADPVTLTHEGHPLTVYYVDDGGLMEILDRFYGVRPELGIPLANAHHNFGHQLLRESADGEPTELPDSHPLTDPGVNAVVVYGQEDAVEPETTTDSREDDGEEEAAEEGVETPLFPADVIAGSAIAFGVEEDALADALATVKDQVDVETLAEADILAADRDPVTVTVDDQDVTVAFVSMNGLSSFAMDALDLDSTTAEAVRSAHNERGETLASEADLPADVRQFRVDADAVVIPG